MKKNVLLGIFLCMSLALTGAQTVVENDTEILSGMDFSADEKTVSAENDER